MVLDWDSQFLTTWVPCLTITFSYKNTALSAKILNVNGCSYLRELSLAVFVTNNTRCNLSLFLLCLKHKWSA